MKDVDYILNYFNINNYECASFEDHCLYQKNNYSVLFINSSTINKVEWNNMKIVIPQSSMFNAIKFFCDPTVNYSKHKYALDINTGHILNSSLCFI